ncbi:MAG: 50S ribosomal protein L29 [Candidatus Peribacteraceae bacterium]|jgi:ribosomal protein L29
MANLLTMDELKNMQMKDLLREIREQSALVAKLRLGISMNKEKDTARFTKEKTQLARMHTVLTENMRRASSSTATKSTTVSSPKKS